MIELITYFSSLGSTSSESLNICPILPVSFCIFFVISSSPKSSVPSSPVATVSSSPSVSPSSSLKSSVSSSEKPNSSSATSSSTGASAAGASGVADAGASTLSTFFSSVISSSKMISSSFSNTKPNPAPPAIALPSDSKILTLYSIP